VRKVEAALVVLIDDEVVQVARDALDAIDRCETIGKARL
jgi:hypothetical protein